VPRTRGNLWPDWVIDSSERQTNAHSAVGPTERAIDLGKQFKDVREQ
jgi:hypothetical protein